MKMFYQHFLLDASVPSVNSGASLFYSCPVWLQERAFTLFVTLQPCALGMCLGASWKADVCLLHADKHMLEIKNVTWPARVSVITLQSHALQQDLKVTELKSELRLQCFFFDLPNI